MNSMRCPRCKNEDPRLFGYDNGVYYCRRCISFSRVNIGDSILPCTLSKKVWKEKPKLDYELTDAQKEASSKALSYLKQGKDVFVYAARCV